MAPRPGMPGTNLQLPNLGNGWFQETHVLCFSFLVAEPLKKCFVESKGVLGAQPWKFY